ncbi:MAG: hypothetical protein JWM11_4101 [Planctomycetaceae bacterium]|nr:hypothetical protein [Planctomycetaceae bacterium]
MALTRLRVAFGPVAPEFGSWRWLGSDLCDALSKCCETQVFERAVPDCDVAVFIKFKPSAEVLQTLRNRASLVYCPVDIYGSTAEIEADSASLSSFDLIFAHCRRLERYFSAFAPVKYLDHPLKYVVPPTDEHVADGPLLWIGNRGNLEPVVTWVNEIDLSEEIWILTDLPVNAKHPSPGELGFTSRNRIRVENWTCERHLAWLRLSRAALDIKGVDFRSRHKPPAKAFDYLASGLPLAMNQNSSAAEALQTMDFRLAAPENLEYWLSKEYWDATQRLGETLRRELALPRIARQFADLIHSAFASSIGRPEFVLT